MSWLLLLCNVILLNIILSGDNALAISMAASKLPQAVRRKAIVLGSVISILSLIVFVILGSFIIELPFLKSIAGILLLWIAMHLVFEEKDSPSEKPIRGKQTNGLWKAIMMITVADLSMELDNALAMVSAADGKISVLMVGFLVTIPFLIFGSHFIAHFMQKFPWIIHVAATYIAWIAGSMIATDKLYLSVSWHSQMHWLIPSCCVVIFLFFMGIHTVRIRRKVMLKNRQDTAHTEQDKIAL